MSTSQSDDSIRSKRLEIKMQSQGQSSWKPGESFSLQAGPHGGGDRHHDPDEFDENGARLMNKVGFVMTELH